MDKLEKPTTEIKAEFAVRRKRQLICAVPFGGVLLLLFAFMENIAEEKLFGIPPLPGVIGISVIALAALGFSYFNWRCPACKRYLGKSINPKFCQNCGAALR